MATPVSPAARALIDKILKLLDSPNEHESAAAHIKLREILKANGLSMRDIVGQSAEPSGFRSHSSSYRPSEHEPTKDDDPFWQRCAKGCLAKSRVFNPKELGFLHDMEEQGKRPSGPQMKWLKALARKANYPWEDAA